MALTYMPFLKAKPGEISAWREASASALAGSRAVFELVPTAGDEKDIADFVRRIAPVSANSPALTVDSGYLDQSAPVSAAGRRPVRFAAEQLHARGIRSAPVMRLDDGDLVLDDVRFVQGLTGAGAALRLGSEEFDPDPRDAESGLPRLLGGTGLMTDQIDLVVDMWAVGDGRSVRRGAAAAIEVIEWAASKGAWRSVTVLSGAFPASISDFDKNAYTPIVRYDADVWDAVSGAVELELDFGDYGVVLNPQRAVRRVFELTNLAEYFGLSEAKK